MEVGRSLGSTEKTETCSQEDSYGDVLISPMGVACPLDWVTRFVLHAGGKEGTFNSETLFCFIFDMCR